TSILEVLPRTDESRSSASPHSNTMDCLGRVMSAEERGAHGEYLDAAENSLPPTRVRSTAAAAAPVGIPTSSGTPVSMFRSTAHSDTSSDRSWPPRLA